ncbi:MAG: penicillin-binding protein 2 [Deltaproteobacteria bacterium]|nr:penicillin-binding protein 2 [Candidatus Zymogenaceae bacterium]
MKRYNTARTDNEKASAARLRTWRNMRIGFIMLVFLLMFGVVVVRLFNLMLLNRDKLYSLAEKQHRVISTYITKRGNIFDTNGIDLAVSLEMDSIYACPYKVEDLQSEATLVSDVVSIDRDSLVRKLSSDKNFVWVKRRANPSIVSMLDEKDLDSIGYVKEDKRFYPHGNLAGAVIGFVGTDNRGLAGLEYEMDDYLRSTVSHYIAIKDASGHKLFEVDPSKAPALKNYDLTLTLDIYIQHIAERELARGVEKTGALGGCAVVMDPKTGEVLAMAGYPGYDPNRFLDSPQENWRNKAVSWNFEPGSTFKIFLAAGVLEYGVAAVDDVFDCEGGSFDVSTVKFTDHESGFGLLSVSDIITHSSNIGAVKLGLLMGSDRYYHTMSSFGFGDYTDITLPGEEKGMISDPSVWNEVDLAAASFGHGLSVTPLQLIAATAAIANGGELMKPYIVKEIGTGDESIFTAEPEVTRRVISEETANLVMEMMERVVREGTGTEAVVEGFRVAGKTGTAQIFDPATGTYSDTEYNSSFVGVIPADDPKLVILVVLEQPKTSIYGGDVAAPVFSAIAASTMYYLGEYPEYLYARGDTLTSPDGEGREPVVLP